jgi:2,3-dihydroxybenzoate decarboxylase
MVVGITFDSRLIAAESKIFHMCLPANVSYFPILVRRQHPDMTLQRPFTIAIEEHYNDPELVAHFTGLDLLRPPVIDRKLLDLDEVRLREMDEGAVDIQVLSHAGPTTQKLTPDVAVQMAKLTNDRLAGTIKRRPDRFAGFAVLPTPAPEAAADELERCVTELGFKGAVINGLTNGKFIDEPQFWPILARAEALGVPIYLHPALPSPEVEKIYYDGITEKFPEFRGPVWGFTAETATQAIRMVLSGALSAYPKLQLILGHLGEALPFMLWRIDDLLARPVGDGLTFSEIFRRNFHLTTSGNFSDTALSCSIAEMGVDRILFAVDWPFASNKAGTDWMMRSALSKPDKAKILGGNARRLLNM